MRNTQAGRVGVGSLDRDDLPRLGRARNGDLQHNAGICSIVPDWQDKGDWLG